MARAAARRRARSALALRVFAVLVSLVVLLCFVVVWKPGWAMDLLFQDESGVAPGRVSSFRVARVLLERIVYSEFVLALYSDVVAHPFFAFAAFAFASVSVFRL